MMAGVTVVAWYPITPSSSLPETLIGYMKKYRDATRRPGRRRSRSSRRRTRLRRSAWWSGAGWAGARAMTSTSGPGISLMSEFAGLAYYAEVPGRRVRHPARRAVDRPADADRAGRHPLDGAAVARRHQADPAHPGSVEECYTMAMDAFDLAERFQTLVFVMSDLDLGHEHVDVAAVRLSRASRSIAARCSTPTTLQRLGRVGPLQGRRRRRHSVPDDPGRPACRPYFTRGSGPQREAASTASARTTTSTTWTGWRASSRRRASTCRSRRSSTTPDARDRHHRLRHQPLGDRREPGSARAGSGAQDGVPPTARLSRSPTSSSAFIDRYKRIYVVEQNRDAQMLSLMRLELGAPEHRQAAQACCITTGCRSMRGRLPTRS